MNLYMYIWLALAIILAIIEIATLGLSTIWFVIGALVAMIPAAFNLDLGWQVATFLLVSILLLIFTRPIALKYLKIGKEKTNVDSLIGKVGIITEPTDNLASLGRVKVNGQSWSARSIKDSIKLEKDTKVIIKSVSGVKLIVKKFEGEN